MTWIRFTSNIQRHVTAPDFEVEAHTVGEALARYFIRYPAVRHYVLDNQGESWSTLSTRLPPIYSLRLLSWH